MKYRGVIPVLLLAALSLGAYAQENPGAEAMGLLSLHRGAARSAMAGAGSASVSSSAAFGAFDNPAALPFTTRIVDAAASYGMWAPGSAVAKSDNISLGVTAKPWKALALSVAAVNQAHPAQNFGDDTYKPLDGLISAGAGVAFGKHVGIGASFIYAHQRLMPDYSLSAYAFHIAAQYHAKNIDVTAAVRNIGPAIKSEKENEYALPSSARLGATYNGNVGKSNIEASLDMDVYFSGKFTAAAGVQYCYDNLLYARAGYRFAAQGAPLPSHLALGIGVKWKGFCLDAAYITANDIIGNSFAISIGYRY